MITTQSGGFEADSPFLNKPWARGLDNIGVDQSRSGGSIVVQPLPQANVVSAPIFNVPTPPLQVGMVLGLTSGGITFNETLTYVGTKQPP